MPEAAPLPAAPAPAPAGQSDGDGGPPSASTPGLALLPPGGAAAPGTPGSTSGHESAVSLPGNVGKLYGVPQASTSVSFQPAAGSNEIVTVVTNTQTGKVIVQFPSETLVALAQFFQKLDNSASNSGAVVDKKV